MNKLKNKLILILLFFALAITFCGTSAAATTTHSNNTLTKNSTTHAGDPIINGTVYIYDYNNKTVANATVTINSTTGRTLATTTTNQNGFYSVNFYSTNTSFYVTASYPGCTSVTQTVTVAKSSNSTDPNYYGTGNFNLTVQEAQLTGIGDGDYNLYINYAPDSDNLYFAGVIDLSANSKTYDGYCIDLYTPISINDYLWINGPLPGTTGTLPTKVDWSAVTYIINHYSATSNDEAAAIQCAIWYYSTAEYGAYPGTNTSYPGRYQYMTYSQDAMIGSNSTVRNLALTIINQTQDMLYPNSIILSPGIANVPNGQAETVTATVYDQNGNPLSGVTVNFSTSSGSLSSNSGTTNSSGQVTVTLTPPSNGNNTSISVTGQVSGNYGNLLYDNPTSPLQNLVALNVLPNIVSATSILNYATTANVTLTQTVNSPVKVGDTVTYIVTATNTGSTTATGIMINDIAPSGLSGVTYTNSTGTTYFNGVWTIPTLTSGSSATLTISGTATSAMIGLNTTNNATRFFQNEYDNQNVTSLASVYTLIPTKLTVNNSTGIIGNTVNLTATLTDNNNNPVVGATVNFYVNNGTTPVGSGTTNSNGIAIYSYTIPMTLTRGTYPVNATYNGNSTYLLSNGSGNLTVNTIPTTLTVNPVSGYQGSSVSLTATLTNSGQPVSGETVTFYVNGVSVGTGVTNGSGVATYQYKITQTNGTYTINATFNGDNTYTNSTGINYLTVNKQANIVLTNTASNSAPNVNQEYYYTINLTNNGPNSASGVTVNDPIPSGLTFNSYTSTTGTSYNSATGVWTIGGLANGATDTLILYVTPTSSIAGANITNTATENQNEYPNTATNSCTVHIPQAVETLTNVASNSAPDVGQQYYYTVKITNAGGDNATGVSITDLLPAGLTFNSYTSTVGTYNSATGVWTIGTLANGVTDTLTLYVTPLSSAAGTNITTTATESQNEYPPTSPASSTVHIPETSVTITNVASPTTGNVGNTGTFTLTATNGGPDSATGVTINDPAPAGFVGTPSAGTTYTGGVWTIGTLAKGATATLTFTGTLTSGEAGTTIVNSATESQNEYPPVTIPNASIYVKNTSVTVTNVANPTTGNVGNTGTFTVTATNSGPDSATGVTINDPAPAGFVGTPSAGTTYTGGVWTIGTLAKNGTATLTFTGTLTSGEAGTTITNAATETQNEYPPVTIPNASIYVKDTSVVVTDVASPTTGNVGNSATFTLTATNGGPDSATGVVITDAVPSGFTAGTPSVGTYSNGVWTIGTLAKGATATLNFTGTLTASEAGTNVTNAATETQNEYPPVTIPNASIYVKDTSVVVTDVASPTTGNVGNSATFTLTATNGGPDSATGVVITDAVPSGFTAGTPSVGTYSNGVWTIGTLAKGATATLNFTGTLTASEAGTNVTNAATETQNEYPPVTIPNASIYVNDAVVSVTNVANPTTGNVGNSASFTVTATNGGPDSATGVVITDAVPSGFTAGTPSVGTYSNGVWTIGTLAKGATATLNFTGTLTASEAGTNVTNAATETQNEYPPVTIPNASIYVKEAAITLTNTPSNPTPNVGQQYYYTVNLTNNGPDSATGVIVTDLLPNGLTYNSYTSTPGTNYNITTGVWTIGTLTNGTTDTLTIYVTPLTSAAGTNITNTANETQNEYPNNATANSKIHIPDPNVIITNTGNPTIVNVGNTINFTLNVENNGPDSATGINIKDQIPSGFTYNSYTSSIPGSYNPTTGIWTVGTLTDGDTAWLTLTGTAATSSAGTNITNIATEINNEYPFTVIIPNATVYVKEANVTLAQTGGYSGNTVTFIVTATNNGPDNASNISINDAIPAGLTNYSVTPSVGSYSNGVWTIPSLANGVNATLNITGTSVPQSTTVNTANLTGQTEYNPNIPYTSKFSVYTPSVEVVVVQDPWYYDPSTGYQTDSDYLNTIVYSVEVGNVGVNDATGVIVNDVLGSGYQFLGCSTEGVGTATYNNLTNTLTWNVGSMPSGGIAFLSILALVNATGDNTPQLTVNASVVHVDQYDVPDDYKSSSYSIYVAPSVDIPVTQNYTTYISNGKTYVIYTITTGDNGPDNATGVQITDQLPKGLSYVSSSPSTGTYNHTTGLWNIGNLQDNQTETLTITAQITATSGTIQNTATLLNVDQNDWNYNDNSQTSLLKVSGTYTASVEVVVVQDPWYYDPSTGYQTDSDYLNTIVYSVEVGNVGVNDATGVVVNDVLGSGYQFLGCSTEGVGTATFNNLTNTLTWNVGSMPSGGIAFLSIFALVNVTGNNTPQLTVNASVVHVDQYDVPDNYKSSNYTIYVAPSVDIPVTQNYTTYISNGKTYVTYTITIVNNGPNNATGVQISDQLLKGLSYVSSIPSTGTYNPTTGIWNIGNLQDNQTETLTITAQITATSGTIQNTATLLNVDQNDWNYNDNSQTTIISNL